MLSARFQMRFEVPVARAWELLTDYAGYARFPGVSSARVVEQGQPDPAGFGAVREIRYGGITFVEQIVEFVPLRVLGYKIIDSRPLRIDHQGGRMELTSQNGGTELQWMTTFAVRAPVIGGLLTHLARSRIERDFSRILHWIKTDLERGSQPR